MDRMQCGLHIRGQDSTIKSDLALLLRYLLYGKEDQFNSLMLLVCRKLAFSLPGLLVGRGKKSQISRDFQGQIRGKKRPISREFRGNFRGQFR